MKKRLISILIVLALLGGTAAATAGVVTYTLTRAEYPVLINGEAMSFTDAVPMEYEGRTMLPVRAVAEALGVPIKWNEDKRQVEIETLDIEALKKSCVMVYSGKNGEYNCQSSGVKIDYDKILVAYHAVDDGADIFKVYYNNTERTSNYTLTKTVPALDAAILAPPEEEYVTPARIGDSDEVKKGDTVYVVSSPGEQKNVVTKGKIKNRSYSINGIVGFIIDPISKPGSSGGGVFNTKGELIGIIEAGDDNLTFAVRINDIRRSLVGKY